MRGRGLTRFLVPLQIFLLLASLFLPALAAAGSAPSVTSDLVDYAPGSTVTLTGAGWDALEPVHITVNDDAGQTWSYTADVTADADGLFTDSFQLPDWFVATYSVTATGPTSGTATTTFADSTLGTVDSLSTVEGNSISHPLNVTVHMSGSATGTTLYYRTVAGTATGGAACGLGIDYVTTSQLTGFSQGNTDFTIPVTICEDPTPETNEAFTLQVADNAGFSNTGGNRTATGNETITNDDNVASIADVSQAEGNGPGTSNMTFTVSLSHAVATGGTIKVNYAFTDGTATNGICASNADYNASNGALTFTAAQSSQPIVVPICGDTTLEGNDTFTVTLTPNATTNTAVVIGAGTATGTILNDDVGAVTVTTTVKNAATNASATSIPLDGGAYDTATLGGVPSGFSLDGTTAVTYSYWTNGTCSGTATSTDSVNVTAGVAGQSPSHLNLAAGSYSFKAHYNGNANYAASTGDACEPFSVGQAGVTVITTVKNAADNTTVSAPLALNGGAYDTATLSGQVGGFSLDGTTAVTYSYWTNGTCSGTATSTDSVNVTAGVAGQSPSHLNLAAGSYSFKAHYNGNANYAASTGDACEPFSVAKADPGLTTSVLDHLNNDVTGLSVPLGEHVQDSAVLTGVGSFPLDHSATVTYNFFSNGSCGGSPTSSTSTLVQVTDTVADSTQQQPGAGSYAFQAVYSGNTDYNAKTGACEAFSVSQTGSTVTTVIQDATNTPIGATVPAGTTVHDTATLATQVNGFKFSGSVTYEFFSTIGCTGSHVDEVVTVNASTGTVPNSSATTPSAGAHSYLAVYGGDSNYTTSTGSCEAFTVVSSNTPPSIVVTGVSDGASYDKGSVPVAGCSVTDAEDGGSSFAATLGAITGPYASDGIGLQTASCAYTDGGGLSTSASATYSIIDPSAPSISYLVTPTVPDGSNGWYKSTVTLVWTVADPESPNSVVKTGCVDQSVTSDMVLTTFSCSASSAGGSTGPVNVSFKVDVTAPTITLHSAADSCSLAGNGGWCRGTQTAGFSVTDLTSGTSAPCVAGGGSSCDFSQVTGANGSAVSIASGSVTDLAGNTASSIDAGPYKIDSVAPSIVTKPANDSCSLPGNGSWCRGTQTAGFSASDATSGITAPPCAIAGSSPCDFSQSTGTNGSAVTISSGTVSDVAGNTAGSINSAPFMIDSVAPTITCQGASFILHQPNATVSATVADSTSGPLASPATAAANTNFPGTFSVSITGYDMAGNAASQSCSYVVGYAFSGFFAPVDRPNTMNASKAGQAIPLKWLLTDYFGTGVTTVTSVTVIAHGMTCDLGASTDQIEEYATGASGLINLGGGNYQFNWKTPTSYVKSCKFIELDFGGGVTYTPTAYFSFVK